MTKRQERVVMSVLIFCAVALFGFLLTDSGFLKTYTCIATIVEKKLVSEQVTEQVKEAISGARGEVYIPAYWFIQAEVGGRTYRLNNIDPDSVEVGQKVALNCVKYRFTQETYLRQ